jgi:hypothetical protein
VRRPEHVPRLECGASLPTGTRAGECGEHKAGILPVGPRLQALLKLSRPMRLQRGNTDDYRHHRQRLADCELTNDGECRIVLGCAHLMIGSCSSSSLPDTPAEGRESL